MYKFDGGGRVVAGEEVVEGSLASEIESRFGSCFDLDGVLRTEAGVALVPSRSSISSRAREEVEGERFSSGAGLEEFTSSTERERRSSPFIMPNSTPSRRALELARRREFHQRRRMVTAVTADAPKAIPIAAPMLTPSPAAAATPLLVVLTWSIIVAVLESELVERMVYLCG